jgi:hypothetical protein
MEDQPWLILTERYGKDFSNPTDSDLAAAIAALYHERLSLDLQSSYEEHGAAWLRLGQDDGPMYVIEIGRLSKVTFEEWADQDYEEELCEARRMTGVSEDMALQFWMRLKHRDLHWIRSQRWEQVG